jgi:hypothetical protein
MWGKDVLKAFFLLAVSECYGLRLEKVRPGTERRPDLKRECVIAPVFRCIASNPAHTPMSQIVLVALLTVRTDLHRISRRINVGGDCPFSRRDWNCQR